MRGPVPWNYMRPSWQEYRQRRVGVGGRSMGSAVHAAVETREAFDWQPQPAAARLVRQILDTFCNDCTAARDLAAKLYDQSGTRLSDWVDHYGLRGGGDFEARLRNLGFVLSDDRGPRGGWGHP